MAREKKIRILVGKVGLDGHDRGVRVVASWLRDGGMEVIYAGRFLTPRQAVKIASDEDVDAIGLSFLAADHILMVEKVLSELKRNNLELPLIVGGIIPKDDMRRLREMGVAEVFGPGTPMAEVVAGVSRAIGA
jgi:methylmalonyl-CoA mutase, C-terminal domain